MSADLHSVLTSMNSGKSATSENSAVVVLYDTHKKAEEVGRGLQKAGLDSMKTKIVFTLLLMASSVAAGAQETGVSAAELVRQVVPNELRAANAAGHYMYTMRNETARGSETKEMIETKDWLIGRLIRINDKPLTPEQRKKEDQRLARLLSNTSQLQKEREGQKRNEMRVRDLFKVLPDAFHYEYAGSEKGDDGADRVRLNFHPNPSFNAPSRELRALEGMEGTVLIDTRSKRIVRFDARLTRHVDFAWGILAHLDPGGSFLLDQRDVGTGRWQITTLALHFTGKILVFKTLEINSTVTTSNFRRMLDNLSLTQGLELLRERDQMEGG